MYLNYCRGLTFDEAPDYMYLRQVSSLCFLRFQFNASIQSKTVRVKTVFGTHYFGVSFVTEFAVISVSDDEFE